jgi:hypothetical protein
LEELLTNDKFKHLNLIILVDKLKYKVLIFLVIGICLYLVDTAMSADEDKNIFVSDQEILSLISAWKSQGW